MRGGAPKKRLRDDEAPDRRPSIDAALRHELPELRRIDFQKARVPDIPEAPRKPPKVLNPQRQQQLLQQKQSESEGAREASAAGSARAAVAAAAVDDDVDTAGDGAAGGGLHRLAAVVNVAGVKHRHAAAKGRRAHLRMLIRSELQPLVERALAGESWADRESDPS